MISEVTFSMWCDDRMCLHSSLLISPPPPPLTPLYASLLSRPSLSLSFSPSLPSIPPQKYKFTAENLVDMGHLGNGAYGTVSKMVFPPTNTTMAVKVCVCVCAVRRGANVSTFREEIFVKAAYISQTSCNYTCSFPDISWESPFLVNEPHDCEP